jgi:hypothetical protein
MKIAIQTLEKMEAATVRPPRAARKPWQFSILALVALTMTSSLALVVSKPYWPVLKETLWPRPKAPERRIAPVVAEPELPEAPLPKNLTTKWVCGPCGQG